MLITSIPAKLVARKKLIMSSPTLIPTAERLLISLVCEVKSLKNNQFWGQKRRMDVVVSLSFFSKKELEQKPLGSVTTKPYTDAYLAKIAWRHLNDITNLFMLDK